MVDVAGDPVVGVEQLATELGLDLSEDPHDPVRRAWASAVSDVDHQLAEQYRPIEAHVLDAVRLEVAQAWFQRLARTTSGSQYVDLDGGQPVRAPRDPLNSVLPILDRYRVAL